MSARRGEGERAGGVYVPPFKAALLHSQSEPNSEEFQRQSWEALRKSLNGLVNKVNLGNLPELVEEIFKENLVRGRGLFCRSLIRSQLASPGFTNVYAALLAVVNSKLPDIGQLCIKRLIIQFRRSYKRNDKVVCLACLKFIAHMVNQRIGHEILALQVCALLLEFPTEDSVECAVSFVQEVGQMLSEVSKKGFDAIFARFRGLLSEGKVEKKTQYTIEKLFKHLRNNFADFPSVVKELDLVEEDDKVTHEIDLLDDTIKGEEMLNIFKKSDPEIYQKEEQKWAQLSAEILGERAHDGSSEDSQASDDEEDGSEAEEPEKAKEEIRDLTQQEMINLRKTIYLCIMSSLNFEECVHKILKLNIPEGQEGEVCTMLIDCSAMERTFQRFFALQADRLCRINEAYKGSFSDCFVKQYNTVHRLETNKLRNTAKFFALLFYTEAISWELMNHIVITEESTTASSRIFLKILFQELCEHLGLQELNKRLHDKAYLSSFQGLFPIDSAKNTRFAINFFTAIGLGGLTEDLRLFLKVQS